MITEEQLVDAILRAYPDAGGAADHGVRDLEDLKRNARMIGKGDTLLQFICIEAEEGSQLKNGEHSPELVMRVLRRAAEELLSVVEAVHRLMMNDPDTMWCPKCGRTHDPGTRRCGHCDGTLRSRRSYQRDLARAETKAKQAAKRRRR